MDKKNTDLEYHVQKNYTQIITSIRDIHRQLEQEFKQELPIGVCHPGVHSPQTGLVKNVPNISWLEKKTISK
jgi:fructokinase